MANYKEKCHTHFPFATEFNDNQGLAIDNYVSETTNNKIEH